MKRNCLVLAVGLITLAAFMAGGAAGRPALAATIPTTSGPVTGGACDAFAKAYQFPGADGITPAAWSGDGLTVPACGPSPNSSGITTPVYPYPGALRTPGYQCVEFSERYLFYRYGVTMGSYTDGDQVAAHYAAKYPELFMVVKNGTPGRAPVDGDVLSMSEVPGFDSDEGGHTAVVQASSVDAEGDGSVTIVEENAVPSGVQVLPVTDWTVHYDGFPYLEWLTAAGLIVTAPALPAAEVSRAYSARLTAAGGPGPYRWAVTAGSLPDGLTLSASGLLSRTVSAASAAAGDAVQTWTFTVTVRDAKGAVARAPLGLPVTGSPEVFSYDAASRSLRDIRWTGGRWDFTTLDGAGSTLPGRATGDVGTASSAVEIDGQPMVFYSDTTTGSLRVAGRTGGGWRFETLDGPGSTLAGHTDDQVGAAVSAVLVDGRPLVFYADSTSGSVRYAGLTATGWQLETLDGPGSVLAQHTWHRVGSVLSAVVADGQPQVYYYDTSADALHRAWWNGSRWLFLAIDGSASQLAGHTADQVGSAISATVIDGRPQLFYADATSRSLRQAWLAATGTGTETGWRFGTLDGPGSAVAGHTADDVGSSVGVTQMDGAPQVYYYDATAQSLRHAWRIGSAWRFETLDGAWSVIAGHDTDHVGAAVSVTELPAGPEVFYSDASRGSLRLAGWTANGWQFETLDGPGASPPGHTAEPVGRSVSVTLY